VAYVDRPKKNRSPHQRVRFLQPSELDKLIDAAPEDTLGGVERALYLAAALTGLRQGELLALKWLDVDLSVGRIRVADNFTRGRMDTPKSHEGRSVPMAARLAMGLEGLRQRSRFRADSDLVFCHPDTGNVLDRHCAPDPSNGAAFVERAFGEGRAARLPRSAREDSAEGLSHRVRDLPRNDSCDRYARARDV
jgi:integrase